MVLHRRRSLLRAHAPAAGCCCSSCRLLRSLLGPCSIAAAMLGFRRPDGSRARCAPQAFAVHGGADAGRSRHCVFAVVGWERFLAIAGISYVSPEVSRTLLCIGASLQLPYLCSAGVDHALRRFAAPARALAAFF